MNDNLALWTIIASFAAAAAVIVAVWQVIVSRRENRRALHIQNFVTYCKRFDEIWGRVPLCVNCKETLKDLGLSADPRRELFLRDIDWYSERDVYVRVSREANTQGNIPGIGPNPQGFFNTDYGTMRKLLNRYIDLCYEEWRLADTKDVHSKDYELWKDGVAEYMKYPSLQAAWRSNRDFYSKQTKFRDEMDKMANYPLTKAKSE